MSPELKEKLEKHMPYRVVVNLKDGKVVGIVEHSFSIGDSERDVRIWWSGKAYSMLGEHMLDAQKDAVHNAREDFVFDPMSEDCPIVVDWERWLKSESKYDKRNARFTVKPFGTITLKLAVAERELKRTKESLESWKESAASRGTRLEEYQEREDKLRALLNPEQS